MQANSLPQITVQRDTRAWQFQVWLSFGVAVFLCGTGLAWLPGASLDRAFMVMGYVFCLSAAFVLAKFVRDSQRGASASAGDAPMWKLVVWGGFLGNGPDRLGLAAHGHQRNLQGLPGRELAFPDQFGVHAGQGAARPP